MRIAREGWLLVLVPAAVAAGVAAVALALGGWWWWAAAGLALVAVGTAAFFRDPRRVPVANAQVVLSPADGRVVEVSEAEEAEWLDGSALKISIFLSLFDVHVNRYPVGGIVEHVDRRRGGFEPAWRPTASAGNARVSVGIRTPDGARVLVRQVAGLVARRIVNPSRIGDAVAPGQRMGMIRFGSRADVFLPLDARPEVRVGDRARGGVTVIARLR